MFILKLPLLKGKHLLIGFLRELGEYGYQNPTL
jgi:hypothetical protein